MKAKQMDNLVTVQVASEILGTTRSSIMTSACVHRKKHGVYPDWYISNGKRGAWKSYVDIDIILARTQAEYDAYEIGTNDIWWKLLDLINANQMAIELSKLSTNFPKFESWRAFIHIHLFSSMDKVKFTDKITMRQEFVILGRQIIESRSLLIAS